MSYETFQHLRIRLPKWLTSWVIFLVDLIPAFIAYWFILITGAGLTGLSTLVYFALMESFWGVLFFKHESLQPRTNVIAVHRDPEIGIGHIYSTSIAHLF